jgi:UDP-glucuronate decarboxylase
MTAALSGPRLEFSAGNASVLYESGLRVVVTGAGGWLGRASLEMLEAALGAAFDSRVRAYGSRARTVTLRSGRDVPIASLSEITSLTDAPTLMLHYAFLTKDRVAGLSPEEYLRTSDALSDRVEAAIARIGVSRMLFPSSGAVYGQPMRIDRSVLLEPETNPYGTQKLRDERRFMALCARAGVRLSVPRVFSLSGPYINKQDVYVLASIINAVLAGSRVELRARRRVVRSYVGVRDLLDVAIGWLLQKTDAEQSIFDSGGEPIEVGDLAQKALQALGRQELEVARPAFGTEPDDRYFGDGAQFELMAAQQGVEPAALDQQIRDTAAFLAAEPR